MKVLKKAVSVFMALALSFTMLCGTSVAVVSAATSGNCGATGSKVNYSYDESTNVLTISGTGAIKDYYNSTAAGLRAPWYEYKSKCVSIVIQDGVTKIGNFNFSNMTALKSVTFPSSSLTAISMNAFEGCKALTQVVFPNSLTSIGYSAFKDCTNLAKVVYGDGMSETGSYAFYGAGVSSVKFGKKITKISQYSFYQCHFTKIELPEQISSVELRSFANNYGLIDVTVNNANCQFNGLVADNPFAGSQHKITFHGHSRSTTQTFVETNTDSNFEFVSLDPCAHVSSSEVVTKEATCTEPGEKKIVCDQCSETLEIVAIEALGHSYATVETDDQTKTNGHLYEYQACTRIVNGVKCNAEQTKITHNAWVSGYYTQTSTATCTRYGYTTKTCNVEGCGKTERSTVPEKLEHSVESYTVTKKATCTEDGTAEGFCTSCNQTVQKTIPAMGHNETITKNETSDNGHTTTEYTCSVCGNVRTEIVHNEWVEGYYKTSGREATCTRPGSSLRQCNVCGKTDTPQVIPAKGHSYGEQTVTKEPTCTEKGTATQTCTVCGDVKTISIDALGHDINGVDDYTVLKEPSCTEQGKATGTCRHCSQKIVETLPYAHDYHYSGINIAALSFSYTCSKCGDVSNVAATKVLAGLAGSNFNKKTSEAENGYIYDVNNDGYINVRDYSIIMADSKKLLGN